MLAQRMASRIGTVNWHHICSEDNPSDECTRGTELKILNGSKFIGKPAFLLQPRSKWPRKQFDMVMMTIRLQCVSGEGQKLRI